MSSNVHAAMERRGSSHSTDDGSPPAVELWTPPDPLPPPYYDCDDQFDEVDAASPLLTGTSCDDVILPLEQLQNEPTQTNYRTLENAVIPSVVNGWKDTVSEWARSVGDHKELLTVVDRHGGTVLHYAAWFNKPEILEEVLSKGADANTTVEYNTTALHLASRQGNEEAVKVLLSYGADPKAAVSCGWTAMHFAAENKCFAVMELLAENGADPNISIEDKLTPLHVACEKGQKRTVQNLLRHKADPKAKTGHQITPLHLACRWGHTEIVDILLTNEEKGEHNMKANYNGITPLHLACEQGNLHTVCALLEYGEDPNVQTSYNKLTPLHLACMKGDADITNALLQHKASVHIEDSSGLRPVHYAAKCKNSEVMTTLLEEGNVSPNDPANNKLHSTPLHIACQFGQKEVVEVLIDRKADVNARDGNKCTPMHIAAMEGHHQLFLSLIDAGSDINPQDCNEQIPLHLACKNGHLEAVQGLVHRGSQVNNCDNHQNTPLFLACARGYVTVVKFLLEEGVDVTVMNNQQITCLDVAIENEEKEVVLAIVRSDHWKKALRHCSTRVQHRSKTTTPFKRMIEKMPDVAEVVMNRCIKTNSRKDIKAENEITPSATNYRVTFNYEFLDPSHTSTGAEKFNKANHPLSIMVENKCANLLKHPLVTTLLSYKWNSYGQYLFIGNLLWYGSFLLFLTAFSLTVLTPLDATCTRVLNGTYNQSDCPGLSTVEYQFVYGAAIIIILLALSRLFLEIIQLFSLRIKYIVDWINWLEIGLYICAIIFVSGFHQLCFCVAEWQWQCGAFAMLLAWLNLMLFLQKWPRTGVYILMFQKVLRTFLNIVFLAILLVIAFALTLYMLFYDPAVGRTAFTNPILAILRTSTMVTGELDFTDLFNLSGDENNIAFPYSSYIIWIVFLVVMPIILSNLLVGLAVGEVNEIQEVAEIRKIELQVDLLLSIDERRRYFPVLCHFVKFVPVEQEVEPNKLLSVLPKVVKRHWKYIWNGVPDLDYTKVEELKTMPTPILGMEDTVERNQDLIDEVQEMKEALKRVEILMHQIVQQSGPSATSLTRSIKGGLRTSFK